MTDWIRLVTCKVLLVTDGALLVNNWILLVTIGDWCGSIGELWDTFCD